MAEPVITLILIVAPVVLFVVYVVGYGHGHNAGYDQACADYSIAKCKGTTNDSSRK